MTRIPVLVAAGVEAGSLWANTINTVKMAEGFAGLGFEVSLVCRAPARGAVAEAELAGIYGLSSPVRWIQLPARFFGRELDVHWHFAIQALPHLLWLRPRLVFSRNYILPWLSSLLGFPTVAESHAHPDNRTSPFLRFLKGTRRKAFRKLVTISHVLASHYRSMGVPDGKLLVLPDAVDLALFRRPAALPPSPFVGPGPKIVYTGHLYDYKGIPTILEAAGLLPHCVFHLVGGWDQDIRRHTEIARDKRLENVIFHGLKPHAEVPAFLWHADVLLLPPSGKHPSAAWTSPVKLGEYLASGTPVVASDIPALRDWLSDDEVMFFRNDDARDMVRAISGALERDDAVGRLTAAGVEKAERWSYAKRAQTISEAAGLSSRPPASM